MTDGELEPGEARPGGRTARTREAVCRATLRELAERGYGGLTVEGVSERAGVHKATVYRRWGGIDGLIVDALGFAVDDDWTPDNQGPIRDDLLKLVQEALAAFTDPATGPTHAAVVAAAFQSEKAIEAVQQYFADRFGRAATVVDAAVEREELPDGVDSRAVIRAMMAPIYFRMFISREPVGDAEIAEAVDAALAAARAGAFNTAKRGTSPE